MAKARLGQAEIEAAGLEAQLLAAHVLLVDRPWLIAHGDEPFPELAGEAILAARLSGKPLAYILGWREFYGRRFSVRPGVLIPRQETEVLVETALSLLDSTATVLDLGTGSGCIAISLKLERTEWEVVASDISPEALEVARENARELGANVEFVESDLFSNLNGEFDAIVTNPPYIGFDEPLKGEVALFEPAAALYSGPTGMEFYERLSRDAWGVLRHGGVLMMEVGYRQAEPVKGVFATLGWAVQEPVLDLSGVARVMVCTKSRDDSLAIFLDPSRVETLNQRYTIHNRGNANRRS